MKKLLTFLLISSSLSLTGCGEEKVSRKAYENIYDGIWTMWNRSLVGSDYDVAFYGDSRVSGGKFETRFADYNSINLGIGGDRISHCIRRFEMIETTKPELVFLSIGGNDANSTDFSEETFTSQYIELLNLFKNLKITVVLHTIPGLAAYDNIDQKTADRCNANIAKANAIMHSLAEQGDYYLIDLAPLMNNSDGSLKVEYTVDGAHFNDACYEIWFDQIQTYLDAHVLK